MLIHSNVWEGVRLCMSIFVFLFLFVLVYIYESLGLKRNTKMLIQSNVWEGVRLCASIFVFLFLFVLVCIYERLFHLWGLALCGHLLQKCKETHKNTKTHTFLYLWVTRMLIQKQDPHTKQIHYKYKNAHTKYAIAKHTCAVKILTSHKECILSQNVYFVTQNMKFLRIWYVWVRWRLRMCCKLRFSNVSSLTTNVWGGYD